MASKIKVDKLETVDGTGTIALQNQLSGMTTASLPALGSAQMPTGSVLQVVNSIRTTTMTWTSTAIVDQLAAIITPVSTSSKILVQCSIVCTGVHGWQNVLTLSMRRGSSDYIGVITTAGSTATNNGFASMGGPSYTNSGRIMETFTLSYLDSPSTTSATTYTLAARSDQVLAVYTGRWSLNSDAAAVTTITLMEVAG